VENKSLLGAIEAGGTKFVCAVGTGPDDIEEIRFPTGKPDETLRQAIEYFEVKQAQLGPLAALGVGTFGPADVDPKSAKFGQILNTPKKGWQGADIIGCLRERYATLPIAFDTDVNAAAWGEGRWGAGRGLQDFVYITVGTGIGGGIVSAGRLVHGTGHPEIGHLRIPRDEARDPFEGSCPFHGDCLEGLASGTAIDARWNEDPKKFAPDHPAWELEASYLADALVNLSLTLAPQRFILGGGVMEQAQLFPLIREQFTDRLSGYLELSDIERMIVPPELGSKAGVLGSLALADDALTESQD
jgi:fructokinase